MSLSNRIRPANPDDLEQLRQIELECVGASGVPLAQMKWLLEGQGDDPAFYLRVAHDSEASTSVVGFVCWKRKTSQDALYLEILDLSVGKNYREEKIEHSLVAEVVREATRLQCLGVSVNVPSENMAAAAFYLSQEFMLSHTVKQYYGDGSDMDILVKRIR